MPIGEAATMEPSTSGARSTAAPSLDCLLAPSPVSDFLENAWGKSYWYVSGGPPKFDGLFSWAGLNELLETHRLDSPRLRLMAGGNTIPQERYSKYPRNPRNWEAVRTPRLNPRELALRLKEGATIALRSVDELSRPVRELCESLERFFHCRVQTNLYASWSETAGFETHYDDHDVFVLQIAGRKRWKIYGPPKPYPLDPMMRGAERAPESLLWERVLEQGDMLYLPRGWWHAAIPINEPTLHLTVGTLNLTGMDLLARIAQKAQLLDLFRMDLPLFSSGQQRAEHGERLQAALNSLWRENAVDEFLREAATAVPARPRFEFPDLP